MSESQRPDTRTHDVDIAFSTKEIIDKLHLYQISPKRDFSTLSVDIEGVSVLQSDFDSDTFLYQLCDAIKHWPTQTDAETFTNDINNLVYLWLNAFDNDAHTDTILNILSCFKFKKTFGFTKSPKFHLLMHNLVLETLGKYHQITLDYALNFEKNVQLPNTNRLIPNLDAALSQAKDGQITALFLLDFQTANNNFLLPHSVSQTLNKQLAEILKENINENAQLYFGGDSQFDVLITQIKNTTQLDLFAAKLSRAFEDMIFINKQSILIKPLIGCAYAGSNTLNAENLYQNANLALEHAIAKQQLHVTYNRELEQAIDDRIILESKVLDAFDSNNMTLHFQPIVDLQSLKCVGAELLLRWSDKLGHHIAPSIAVEVLNNVGKGKLFTRWLVNSACRYVYELTEEHQLDVYLTINLRAEDLYDIELPSLFSNALSLWKLDPKNIILEITEDGILEHNDHTNSVINALSDLGFKFALDDFGTGFSSLTRLKSLPIDIIKIDQTFVKNISHSKDDYEIVQSIALLAKGLGKQVLAEGVEDKECLTLVKKLKIDKGQGYHFAKALPYESFIEWLRTH